MLYYYTEFGRVLLLYSVWQCRIIIFSLAVSYYNIEFGNVVLLY